MNKKLQAIIDGKLQRNWISRDKNVTQKEPDETIEIWTDTIKDSPSVHQNMLVFGMR
jgi:hypothetical protein